MIGALCVAFIDDGHIEGLGHVACIGPRDGHAPVPQISCILLVDVGGLRDRLVTLTRAKGHGDIFTFRACRDVVGDARLERQRGDNCPIFRGAHFDHRVLRWVCAVGAARLDHRQGVFTIESFVIRASWGDRPIKACDELAGDAGDVGGPVHRSLDKLKIFNVRVILIERVSVDPNLRGPQSTSGDHMRDKVDVIFLVVKVLYIDGPRVRCKRR